ncbi:Hypothetical protein R9X50_00411800 [Acrodontium crateriforme]|uniref:PAC domain-containing protein n=1 Tax=Acrodontium crateriforme TaxID=150365 RepID=A0AAQ3M5K1_9PEZI|nr:Hypothetical protein R9X50_00411800 [Acrodontium crateriforme]
MSRLTFRRTPKTESTQQVSASRSLRRDASRSELRAFHLRSSSPVRKQDDKKPEIEMQPKVPGGSISSDDRATPNSTIKGVRFATPRPPTDSEPPSEYEYRSPLAKQLLVAREEPRINPRNFSTPDPIRTFAPKVSPPKQEAEHHDGGSEPSIDMQSSFMLDASPMVGGDHRKESSNMDSWEEMENVISEALPPLQAQQLDGVDEQPWNALKEDDPASFDLVPPLEFPDEIGRYKLEIRSEQLFGTDHLQAIFNDAKLLQEFTGFLNSHRPNSMPVLDYYLNAIKAIRTLNYANELLRTLKPVSQQIFSTKVPSPVHHVELEERASQAFAVLVQDHLSAYVAHRWAQTVRVQIDKRIRGTLAPHLREASEGLAEVFCLTDPSRLDNPIIFSSDSLSTVTQYGLNYIVGRNCRFLQGPKTSRYAVQRLSEACRTGKEITEIILNYRRDGSPFMNMLTMAPLFDGQGRLKYFLGSQIDVSGLAKQCTGLEGLMKIVERAQTEEDRQETSENKDALESLCEMFNTTDLQKIRRKGGRMYREYAEDLVQNRQAPGLMGRVVLTDPSQDVLDDEELTSVPETPLPSTSLAPASVKVETIFPYWLLVRPAPNHRIIFSSRSLRVPGLVQSEFFDRIGGSSRVRDNLQEAMAEGRGVTAKIRWLTRPTSDSSEMNAGRPRWVHCTPLFDHQRSVGVWMVILVDDEAVPRSDTPRRHYHPAPAVSQNISNGHVHGVPF